MTGNSTKLDVCDNISLNNEKYLLQFSFGHDCSGNDLSILWRWKKISFADLQRDKDKTLLNCKGN